MIYIIIYVRNSFIFYCFDKSFGFFFIIFLERYFYHNDHKNLLLILEFGNQIYYLRLSKYSPQQKREDNPLSNIHRSVTFYFTNVSEPSHISSLGYILFYRCVRTVTHLIFRQRPNKNRLFYGSLLSPNRESEPSLSPLLRKYQASLLENNRFLTYIIHNFKRNTLT